MVFSMTSVPAFLAILVISIVLLMLMIIRWKVHPVMALFTCALLAGIALGYGVVGTADSISSGFGGTLTGVGITIILGAIISMGIEDTGAAKSIANFFIRLFRGRNMELAPALTAFIMSIPVFGDITMVLTAPIASMLSKRKHISMSTMASFTGLALFLTHGLVPPTPGILAIAIMFEADLGLTIFWGTVVSLIAFFGTWILIKRWTEKEWIEPNPEMVKGLEETGSNSIDDILIKEPNMPGTFASFMPLLLPVLLITLDSFAKMYLPADSSVRVFCGMIGHKVIALFIGVLYSLWLGCRQRSYIAAYYKDHFPGDDASVHEIMVNRWVARGLIVCLAPLLITAMGGAFGNILKSSPAIAPLSEIVGRSQIPGILVPWAVAVIMMTAVGSMTTAGMTAAAIILPMMPHLGLTPMSPVLAIGAGTLMFDHVSNSGFWVMGQFFNLDTKQSLKYVTLPSVVGSIIAEIAIALLSHAGLI